MRTKEELEALKIEYQKFNKVFSELSKDELKEVTGGDDSSSTESILQGWEVRVLYDNTISLKFENDSEQIVRSFFRSKVNECRYLVLPGVSIITVELWKNKGTTLEKRWTNR